MEKLFATFKNAPPQYFGTIPIKNSFFLQPIFSFIKLSCLMVNSLYNCSQPELYIICRKGWNLCGDNQSDFFGYKSKYIDAFITENLAAVDAADLMDDSKARYAFSQNLRVDLVEKKDAVVDVFHLLKGYISDAYLSTKVGTMNQAAGQQYYSKASACNWASVSAMLSSMLPFVVNHKAELMDNNNMPADFLTKVQTVKTEFDALYKEWNKADEAAYYETDAKITANNAIYNNLKTMLSDAQRIYRKDEVMALKFSVDDLMSQVRGTRPSNLSGTITNGANKAAIAKAQITIQELGLVMMTDDKGQFQFLSLPVGKYTVVIEAEGFETVKKTKFDIKASVSHRMLLKMSAVEATVPA
jgi:hypothetical protein